MPLFHTQKNWLFGGRYSSRIDVADCARLRGSRLWIFVWWRNLRTQKNLFAVEI